MKLKHWKKWKWKCYLQVSFEFPPSCWQCYKTFFSSPMTPRRNKLERLYTARLGRQVNIVSETRGPYYKTLQIHNLWKMDRFRSKQESFLLSITNTLAWTDTLAFYRIRKLQICNVLLYRSKEPTHRVRHRKVLHSDRLWPYSHSSRQNALAYLQRTS